MNYRTAVYYNVLYLISNGPADMARRTAAPPQPQSANLTLEQMRVGVTKLNRRIAELRSFDPGIIQKRWGPEVKALQTAVEETLASVFGHNTIEYKRYRAAADLDNGPVVMRSDWGSHGHYDDRHEAQKYVTEGIQRSILLLGQAVRGLEEEIGDRREEVVAAATPMAAEVAPALDLSKVFVVHGHDGAPKAEVARFIEKLGFEAVILHERPNKGRALITKFREEAAGVGFAVVLMTPDDLGKAEKAADLNQRARQYVVFELGFFIGKLGPERVTALVKGDIELPSDFDGVVYISLDKEDWQTKLGGELQEAGYEIDWNKVMRR
jgi:predicted nucleotide-binding protein